MGLTTKPSLLAKIKNGDEISWEEFHQTYRPLIWVRGKQAHDLSDCECDELVQMVMLTYFKKSTSFQYDPARGKFRNFMRRMVDFQAKKLLLKRSPGREISYGVLENVLQSDSDPLDSPEEHNDLESHWDSEWRAHVLSQALEELRAHLETTTFQAFDLYVLQGGNPRTVAQFLNISVNAVYLAKHRATKYLERVVMLYETL